MTTEIIEFGEWSMEEELAAYVAAPRPRRWPRVGISRSYAVELAVRLIHKTGAQPSPGRVQAWLGDRIRHGGDLNGRDSRVYATAMRDLGYLLVGHRYGKVKRLAVDHDHETNAVRGLLCQACNTAIGLLNNDPGLARKAAAYCEEA